MPISLSITPEQFAATNVRASASARDMSYRKAGFLDACHKALGAKGTRDGGDIWRTSVSIGNHSEPTAILSGTENINMTVSSMLQGMQFYPFTFCLPIVVTGYEKLRNAGADKVIDLYEARAQRTMNYIMELVNRQVVRGDVAALSRLGTLNGVDYTTTGSAGVLEQDAVGSQTNVIGGLSKATYATIPGMQNQRGACAGSASANLIRALNDICSLRRQYRPPNIQFKTVAPCSNRFATNFKEIFSAQEFFVYNGGNAKTDVLSVGHSGIAFQDLVFVEESWMPNAGSVTGTAGNEISAYVLDTADVKLEYHTKGFYETGNPVELPLQYDTFAVIVQCTLQLMVHGYSGCAVITGADTL